MNLEKCEKAVTQRIYAPFDLEICVKVFHWWENLRQTASDRSFVRSFTQLKRTFLARSNTQQYLSWFMSKYFDGRFAGASPRSLLASSQLFLFIVSAAIIAWRTSLLFAFGTHDLFVTKWNEWNYGDVCLTNNVVSSFAFSPKLD